MSLPNIITLARLLSVPVTVWLILDGRLSAAFAMFVAAGISDAVDGWIAKRWEQRTELGALLDPIADKTLLVAIFVTLGIAGHIPAWLVILAVFRDLLIVGGYILLRLNAPGEFKAKPLLISKANTGFQIALVAIVLARLGLGLDFGWLVTSLVYVTGATTVLSGAAYLARFGRALAGMEAPQ
ncbi:MAG: CDP-alcohol phosphatidyltransferase family protein [Rhodospirillales bacterium]|mgnify:CR=1 FL=1|nr:CDP-alcohol phosphatidyltransferase family protein [Rhodospirillales bacterium]